MPKLLMKAEMFAIRDQETGRYMPQQKRGRGYSFLEVEHWSSGTPRLFWSRAGANMAVVYWRQGPRETAGVNPGAPWDAPEFDPGGAPKGPPPENRKARVLEIVPFTLTEDDPNQHVTPPATIWELVDRMWHRIYALEQQQAMPDDLGDVETATLEQAINILRPQGLTR